jgi:hypothetical protein
MSSTTNEGVEWLETFDARAEEAAILARQNVKIAVCRFATNLVLEHPDSGRHKIKDSRNQIRHQTVPLETETGRIVIGRTLTAPKMSVRTLRAGFADRSTLLFQQADIYSREVDASEDGVDSEPVAGRLDAAILPSQGVRPRRSQPHDRLDGSLYSAIYTDEDILRFAEHITAVANILAIDLPPADDFIGVTRVVRLD